MGMCDVDCQGFDDRLDLVDEHVLDLSLRALNVPVDHTVFQVWNENGTGTFVQ